VYAKPKRMEGKSKVIDLTLEITYQFISTNDFILMIELIELFNVSGTQGSVALFGVNLQLILKTTFQPMTTLSLLY
jgi:hypothetical protein